MKKYKFGVVCGRFQPLHTGHCAVIDKAMTECERVAVFVGSAQEYRTKRNPLNYKERFDAIEIHYLNNLEVYPINDLTNGADVTGEWGRYFLNIVEAYAGARPDAIYTGAEPIREKWFYPEDVKDIAEEVVDRSDIPISASEIREKIIKDNFEDIIEFIPVGLKYYYFYDFPPIFKEVYGE